MRKQISDFLQIDGKYFEKYVGYDMIHDCSVIQVEQVFNGPKTEHSCIIWKYADKIIP